MPKTQSAASEDEIPPLLLRIAPTAMARWPPLMLEASLRITENVSWRSGCIAHHEKGKHVAAHECCNHHETVPGSVSGNVVHRILRSRLMAKLKKGWLSRRTLEG